MLEKFKKILNIYNKLISNNKEKGFIIVVNYKWYYDRIRFDDLLDLSYIIEDTILDIENIHIGDKVYIYKDNKLILCINKKTKNFWVVNEQIKKKITETLSEVYDLDYSVLYNATTDNI